MRSQEGDEKLSSHVDAQVEVVRRDVAQIIAVVVVVVVVTFDLLFRQISSTVRFDPFGFFFDLFAGSDEVVEDGSGAARLEGVGEQVRDRVVDAVRHFSNKIFEQKHSRFLFV